MVPVEQIPTDIAVIVVNYETADLAIAAVRSVLAHDAGGRRVEIHLVDNASPSRDAELLQRAAREYGWSGRVTLHLETENHGFGRGNNLVLKRISARDDPPDKVLLLNPDARLENDAIAIQADFLDAHEKVGFVGARIEKPDGTPVSAAFRFPSMVSVFSHALSFGPVVRRLSRWQVALDPAHPTGRVDWVSGAALMGRLEAFRDAGFFDPAYFLYHEEVDLMLQATRAGWEVWTVAEARYVHAEGAATEVRSHSGARRRRPAYWYESWRHYWRKNHGQPAAVICALLWMTGVALNRAQTTLRRRPTYAPLNFFADAWSHVLRPLLSSSRF